jgi:hypothetical protein
MHCIVRGNILIKYISQVLTNGYLSSKKEVGTSYGEDLGDDGNNTQGTSVKGIITHGNS